MTADLTVVTQDPRFGGGVRSQLESFLDAAATLGRRPEVHFVVHPSLRGDPGEARGTRGALGPFARADALNQLIGARRLARRLRKVGSLWVVSTVAPPGLAALESGCPYACWIGTGLVEEWRGRRPGLPTSRRLALRLNAPALLALERRVLRGASAIYATSPASRESLARAAGLPPERIGILSIPVDTERFFPLPDEEWLGLLETPTIAFVGRGDDPRKNVRLLLDALPLIRRRLPNVRARLIGRPPRERLPEGAEAIGEVESVARELRRCSLLVVPSLQEGFGIVAAEALACGVPVVATACGGPEELLRSSSGGVVLQGWSAGELAEMVVDLLESPGRLAQMRGAGRELVVRRHSLDHFRAQLAHALDELGA